MVKVEGVVVKVEGVVVKVYTWGCSGEGLYLGV